jgi:NAD(P)H-hydrate epimerase
VLHVLAHLDERSTVLAIGPGLGRDEGTLQAVRDILIQSPRPAVLDADGILALKDEPEVLSKAPSPVILTPHPGEMSALLGTTIPDIQNDREAAALEAAERTGKIVVLKGRGTLVIDGERIYENTTGGPALAKGGSGDVLTGMAAALLAQAMEPFDAAVLAVYLHGLAGDLAAGELGPYSVLSRDVADCISKAFLHHGG